MHRAGTAPIAKFLELDLASHELFVFGGPVVNALAFAALEFDESVLGHRIFGIKIQANSPSYTLWNIP